MRDAKKYIRQVGIWLPCTGKLRKQIKEEILTALNGFLEDHPDADYQAIVAQFGTPQQVAVGYVEAMDTPELLNQLRIKKRTVTIAAVAAVVALSMWAGVVTAAYIDHVDDMNGEITTSIDVYEEWTFNEGQ